MQISVPAFSDELTLLPFINLKNVRAIQRDSPPTAASREGECSEAEPEEITQCASIRPANATVPAAALFLAVLATTPVVDLTGGFLHKHFLEMAAVKKKLGVTNSFVS